MEETKDIITEVHNKFLNKKVVITDHDGKKFTGIYIAYCDNDYTDKIEFLLTYKDRGYVGIPVEDVKTIELAEDD